MNDGKRHLGALILAAGASTRLGQPKQLLQVNEETLVERTIRIAREAGAETVMVVLGANYRTIFDVLQPYQPELRVLLNQRWAEGMGTSIALGAAAAERHDVEDLLVLTCDQVAVTPEHLQALVAASHREHVVASTYSGRRGVPALFPEFSFHALQRLSGDRGARELLQHADVLQVPLPGGEIDIDTPGDLEQLTAMVPAERTVQTNIEP